MELNRALIQCPTPVNTISAGGRIPTMPGSPLCSKVVPGGHYQLPPSPASVCESRPRSGCWAHHCKNLAIQERGMCTNGDGGVLGVLRTVRRGRYQPGHNGSYTSIRREAGGLCAPSSPPQLSIHLDRDCHESRQDPLHYCEITGVP
jgi:hypothetical protein